MINLVHDGKHVHVKHLHHVHPVTDDEQEFLRQLIETFAKEISSLPHDQQEPLNALINSTERKLGIL